MKAQMITLNDSLNRSLKESFHDSLIESLYESLFIFFIFYFLTIHFNLFVSARKTNIIIWVRISGCELILLFYELVF